MRENLFTNARRLRAALRLGAKRFSAIDGAQRAAAFAYYAFLSLFPLLMLLVTAGSFFVDRDRAANEVIAYVEGYVPLDEGMKDHVFDTIAGVVEARSEAGVLAFVVLVWSSLKFFTALIRAVNRAWAAELHNWWRLPLKSFMLLGLLASAVLLGIGMPVVARLAWNWVMPDAGWASRLYELVGFILPLLVLFYGVALFYKLAPRRPTRFSEVWLPALLVTMLLRLLETLFVFYLQHFARFSAVYGAFGSVVALLMWIYLSGSLLIFGACLCASRTTASGTAEPAAPEK